MALSIGTIVAEAWERANVLASYGHEPLTVGWYRGEAFVRLWDWRTGAMTWKPLQTSRSEPPKPPRFDPFWSAGLYEALGRRH